MIYSLKGDKKGLRYPSKVCPKDANRWSEELAQAER